MGRIARGAARAALACLVTITALSTENRAATSVRIQLDIPAQPLADALVAFSAATGIEVFYDGALSVGRRSSTVAGELAPLDGLRLLLRGTNYVAQASDDTRSVTISTVPSRPRSEATRRYEPYFALLQARLAEALCRLDDRPAVAQQVVLNLWLDPSGLVSRSDVLGLADHPDRRAAILTALRGVHLLQPTPSGLPQPVTLAIFPAGAYENRGCAATSRHGAEIPAGRAP